MKIKIEKKIDLSYLGEGWDGCFITFIAPSYGQIKPILKFADQKDNSKAVEEGITFLESVFIAGLVATTDEGKKEIKKEDLKDLPLEIINKCFEMIGGTPNPKS